MPSATRSSASSRRARMADLPATLVPALGQALLHFLWQGALIGAFAAFALAALRNARPQARYAVACVALLACVLAPLATLLVALVPDAFALSSITMPAPVAAESTAPVAGTWFGLAPTSAQVHAYLPA